MRFFLALQISIFSFISMYAIPIRCSYSRWNTDSINHFAMVPDIVTKQIPASIYMQASIALAFYPELKDVKIEFVIKKDISPLTTIPEFWSIFKKAQNRTYKIIISSHTHQLLEPILLQNLSFDAQVGVLGHELSHVADFQRYNLWDFIIHAIKYTVVSAYGDRFEYATDMRCISHGLGHQLLQWSIDTHKKLNMEKFVKEYNIDTTKERYMRPLSIKKEISGNTIYNHINPLPPCY